MIPNFSYGNLKKEEKTIGKIVDENKELSIYQTQEKLEKNIPNAQITQDTKTLINNNKIMEAGVLMNKDRYAQTLLKESTEEIAMPFLVKTYGTETAQKFISDGIVWRQFEQIIQNYEQKEQIIKDRQREFSSKDLSEQQLMGSGGIAQRTDAFWRTEEESKAKKRTDDAERIRRNLS